jgi:hypothetical protein
MSSVKSVHRALQIIAASALSLTLSLNFATATFACGPDYPKAVLYSWNHPDLPLKSFVAGDLGIVVDTWAKSYLCVAYRYLESKPLSTAEQASVQNMWRERLTSELGYVIDADFYPWVTYFDLRTKILHQKLPVDSYKWQNANEISDGAFHQALKTLKVIIKGYGENSIEAKQWLKAQDQVFGINSTYKISVPAKLTVAADSKAQAYRDYQIAAATFYIKHYADAEKLFARLATSTNDPELKKLASYLQVRAASEVMKQNNDATQIQKNLSRLDEFIDHNPDAQSKLDIVDLKSLLLSQCLSTDYNYERIVHSIAKTQVDSKEDPKYTLGASGLGRDISDLTFLLDSGQAQIDQAQRNKYDLVDWLDTVSSGSSDFWATMYMTDAEKIEFDQKRNRNRLHALEKWRSVHSNAWLVAVLLCGGLRSDDENDVLDAVEHLSKDSPAYTTASFYLIDREIQKKHFAEARTRLQGLNYASMPVTTVNLFKAQEIACSDNMDKFFAAACMPVAAASSNSLLIDDQFPKRDFASNQCSTFDTEIANELDRYLPFEKWVEYSHKSLLTPNLKQRIICAIWIKAKLLNKQVDEYALLAEMKKYCSKTTSEKISRYENSKSKAEKQFLFAQIVLDNVGMSPYVGAGLPRFAMKLNEFNYYQQNYWLPMPVQVAKKNTDGKDDEDSDYRTHYVADRINRPMSLLLKQYYSTKTINNLLSAEQVKESSSERLVMERAHPSKVLGEAVLTWAKMHSSDPDVPTYLYKIVKLPKWSGDSTTGSEYSKAAYMVLHRDYAASKWAKLAVCWY